MLLTIFTLLTMTVALLVITQLKVFVTHPEGQSRVMPDNVDFYYLNSTQIPLLSGDLNITNKRAITVSLTYPSGIDLSRETIKVWAIDFLKIDSQQPEINLFAVDVMISMLSQGVAEDYSGVATATSNAALRTYFDGQFRFGETGAQLAVQGTDDVDQYYDVNTDGPRHVRWYPPTESVDLLTPLFITFINAAYNLVEEGNPALVVFGDGQLATLALRVWFTTRQLTQSEISQRGSQLQWQRLNS